MTPRHDQGESKVGLPRATADYSDIGICRHRAAGIWVWSKGSSELIKEYASSKKFTANYRNAELPFHHECRQPTCCLPISPSSFLSCNNKSSMGVPQSSISVLGLVDAFVPTLCPSFSLCLPIVLGFSFSSLHALLPFLWVLFLYWSQHLLLSFPVTFRGLPLNLHLFLSTATPSILKS